MMRSTSPLTRSGVVMRITMPYALLCDNLDALSTPKPNSSYVSQIKWFGLLKENRDDRNKTTRYGAGIVQH